MSISAPNRSIRQCGKNYSRRIWGNTRALAQDLKEELLINLVTGRTEREVAEILANKFAQGASNARMLVRTESCFLSKQMEMESYKKCGIETYIYVATLDLRTSEICQSLDGKRFLVAEQQTGKNCPPMHPWCRSTTIAFISEEAFAGMQRRARDPVTGKTYLVPATMNYQEWYEKYVSGNQDAMLAEKKQKNLAADRTQHEKYREILGDEIPKKLDDFQNLKYNESEKWDILKQEYRNQTFLQNQLQYVQDGEKLFIPKNSIIKNRTTIAGAGSKNVLRIEPGLIKIYHGNTGEWKKCAGKIISDKYTFDVHWYERNGKQYDMKLKFRKEN